MTQADYYLLHNVNGIRYHQVIAQCHMFEHMQKWKEEGKIRHIAFSFHDTADVLDKILSEHPEVEAVQIALNYIDWDAYFVQAKACYDVIRKHGRQMIVMEPVKGGMLAKVPKEAEMLMKEVNPDASPASWAIRFAAGLDGVLTVLSGVAKTADFKPYEAINPKGISAAAILDCYNSCMLQPVPTFGAEHNYFSSEKAKFGLRKDDICIPEKVVLADGTDATELVHEAEKFLNDNSFFQYEV